MFNMDMINNKNLLFYVGEKFDSFEALTSKLNAYCKSAFVHYWTRDSRKIGCARILRHIDEKLKYYSLKYTCVLGGQAFQSRGTGKRYSFSIRANNCPAHISIRASKDGMHLEVVSVNNDHNHDQSQEIFQTLPQERRLPDHVKAEVLDLIQLQVDRRRVKEYVRLTTQKLLTTKDLTNIIAAGRHEKRPQITPARSEELLAKVFSNEVETALIQYSTHKTIHIKEITSSPKLKRQCTPSFLRQFVDTDNIASRDRTLENNAKSEEKLDHLSNNNFYSSYKLPNTAFNTQANHSDELPHKSSKSSPTEDPSPDVIVEDSAHFCITCGQALPENHRLLQPVLNPQTVIENVFLSPDDQIGTVEEVVSNVEIVSTNKYSTREDDLEIGSSVVVYSSEGLITIKEEDFEEFVQTNMHS